MPYAFQSKRILLTEAEDSRRKIPTDKHDEIRSLYKNDVPIREIARRFQVDHRLIQFILFPERQEAARAKRDWKKCYKTETNTEAVRRHRRAKQDKLKKRI